MILCLKIGNLLVSNYFKNIKIFNEIYTSNPSLEIIYNDQNSDFNEEKILLKILNFSENIRVLQGKKIEIFYINLSEKEENNFTKLQTRKMIISKISKNEECFFIELESLSKIFCVKKMNYFSENCRASFGDKCCKININNFMIEGEISGFSEDMLEIYDKILNVKNPEDFKYGKLIFSDFPTEELLIFKIEKRRIILLFESHFNLKIGMKYKIFMGCDKSIKTCINRYKNAVNFRGEPFIFEKFPSSSF